MGIKSEFTLQHHNSVLILSQKCYRSETELGGTVALAGADSVEGRRVGRRAERLPGEARVRVAQVHRLRTLKREHVRFKQIMITAHAMSAIVQCIYGEWFLNLTDLRSIRRMVHTQF